MREAIDVESEEVVEAVAAAGPTFPVHALDELAKSVSGSNWSVPVEDGGFLDQCLQGAHEMVKYRLDEQCEQCQRFLGNFAPFSFDKLMTEKAVQNWSHAILKNIFSRVRQFLQLFALKLDMCPMLGDKDKPGEAWGGAFEKMAETLEEVLCPDNKFHSKAAHFNGFYQPYNSSAADVRVSSGKLRNHWLVDLVNDFGDCKGSDTTALTAFDIIVKAARTDGTGVTQLAQLVTPFGGQVARLLKPELVARVFVPVRKILLARIDEMSDAQFKIEKYESIANGLRALKDLECAIGDPIEVGEMLDGFRLKMCLKLLGSNVTFEKQMNGLAEIRKLIDDACTQRGAVRPATDYEQVWLDESRLAAWMADNSVIERLLGSNLHQKEFVHHIVHIIRFLTEADALTLADIDLVWTSAIGKHDVIVANIHMLLGEIADHLTSKQLDHMFQLLEGALDRTHHSGASAREFQRLLELIRTIGEKSRGKTGQTVKQKVHTLLWNVARNESVPLELCQRAIRLQAELLERDAQGNEQYASAELDGAVGPSYGPRQEYDGGSSMALPDGGTVATGGGGGSEVDMVDGETCPAAASPPDPRHVYLSRCQEQFLTKSGPFVMPAVSLFAKILQSMGQGPMDTSAKDDDGTCGVPTLLVDCVLIFLQDGTDAETARTEARWGFQACLTEPLNLLVMYSRQQSVHLNAAIVEQLWAGLVGSWTGKAADEKTAHARQLGYDVFGQYLLPHLDPQATRVLFDELSGHMSGDRAQCAEALSAKGWKCYEQLFFATNYKQGLLPDSSEQRDRHFIWTKETVQKRPRELIGVPSLWYISVIVPALV